MSKNKHYQSDIIISGGGVAGLTLALLLAKQKMTVHLIEPFPPPEPEQTKPSGRTVALMQSSLEIIKTTGIWNKIEPLAAPLEIMRIIDDSIIDDTPVKTDFPAYDIGMDAFGMNIPNGKLRALLFEKAKKQKNITLHIAKKLDGYKAQGSEITAKLDDGGIITAPLIIGADGRNQEFEELGGYKSAKFEGLDVEEMVYKILAITRIVTKRTNIPATTALATINEEEGRNLALKRGANVIMLNVSDPDLKQYYEIYPAKVCLSKKEPITKKQLNQSMKLIGRNID